MRPVVDILPRSSQNFFRLWFSNVGESRLFPGFGILEFATGLKLVSLTDPPTANTKADPEEYLPLTRAL